MFRNTRLGRAASHLVIHTLIRPDCPSWSLLPYITVMRQKAEQELLLQLSSPPLKRGSVRPFTSGFTELLFSPDISGP